MAAAGQDDELFVRFLVDVLDLDHDVAGHLNVTELLGNRQVIDHRPPDHRHLALVASGGVERLLDPVDVGCGGRDDDPARALPKEVLERLTAWPFGWRKYVAFAGGAIPQQQPDALGAAVRAPRPL